MKYFHKEMFQINDNLRVYIYYYASGCRIYYMPKNSQEEVINVWIPREYMDQARDSLKAKIKA